MGLHSHGHGPQRWSVCSGTSPQALCPATLRETAAVLPGCLSQPPIPLAKVRTSVHMLLWLEHCAGTSTLKSLHDKEGERPDRPPCPASQHACLS